MDENRTVPPADHVEQLLDAALEQTFPASDPVAVDVPRRPAAPRARSTTAMKSGGDLHGLE